MYKKKIEIENTSKIVRLPNGIDLRSISGSSSFEFDFVGKIVCARVPTPALMSTDNIGAIGLVGCRNPAFNTRVD